MATERQILNRKRNWNIFLIKEVLDSILRVRRFFIEQDDEAGAINVMSVSQTQERCLKS